MFPKNKRSLVILGNGFDLNLGLHTSFKDFFESKYSPFNKREWSMFDNKENWYDLENFIMEESSSHLLAENLTEHPGVQIEERNRFVKIINLINRKLIRYLRNEEKQINSKKINVRVQKYLDQADSIINFNYTSTPVKIYGLSANKIYYIHGSLKENFIIIGSSNDNALEGSPIMFRFLSKSYLRDILDVRRYLLKNHEYSRNRLENFKTYDKYYYSWRRISPYLVDKKIYKYLTILDTEYDEISHYFSDRVYEHWRKFNHSTSIKIMKELIKSQENVDFFNGFLEYINSNNYRPFKIKIPISKRKFLSPEDIVKITIIGHSLHSDADLILDLFKACQNLHEINIFRYNGEEKERLISILQDNRMQKNIKINVVDY